MQGTVCNWTLSAASTVLGLHVSRYPVPSPLRHCSCCGEKSSALHWARSNARYADAEPQSGLPSRLSLPAAVSAGGSDAQPIICSDHDQEQVITQKLPATDPHARTRSVICLPYCRRTFSFFFFSFFFLKNFRKNRSIFVSVF